MPDYKEGGELFPVEEVELLTSVEVEELKRKLTSDEIIFNINPGMTAYQQEHLASIKAIASNLQDIRDLLATLIKPVQMELPL
jgi:hypothetical protein